MYYIKYNGTDLTDIIKVKEVEIPALPSIKHSSIEVFERDGNIYNGTSYGNREIRLTFIIKPDNPDDYDMYVQDVKRAFYTKDEAKLFCGDETLYMWCVPVDDVTITELGTGCAEGEVNLIAYDPYWYSTEQQAVNNDDANTFTVENKSDVPVYPTIKVGFTKDTTFVQLENQTNGERILIGGIPSTEGTLIKKNTELLHDACETTSGWTSSSAPIDSNRSIGGTLAITTDGNGIMCGDFGSASNGATWHGACYRKSIGTAITDFKVKVRMSFNSSGINGDPDHPYTNDKEDNVTVGAISYYYVVVASGGTVLRKSASSTGTKIVTIPKGKTVTFISSSNGWARVAYGSKTGYCYTKDVKKMAKDTRVSGTACNYVTIQNSYIRSAPDKNSTVKKTIPAGTVIRVLNSETFPNIGDEKGEYFKLAKKYDGVYGYVKVKNLVTAYDYEVDYEVEPETADDKTGVCEVYGFSANNVQLFKLAMCDDNAYWEFTYPMIRKNNEDFLKDKTVAPQNKTHVEYSGDTKKVEEVLSGKYGSWNEFYGELYIERIKNKWYAYVQKIEDGESTKKIKSKTVTDTTNESEQLSYLVIYIGTTGDIDKASGMSVKDISVKTASAIDNTVTYNFQEFEAGDVLSIYNDEPSVFLNHIEHNELIDVGSSFFALDVGGNNIKVASDDTPNVDILWNEKFL